MNSAIAASLFRRRAFHIFVSGALLLATAAIAHPRTADGQVRQSIVVIVNEDAITSFDIQQRVSMLLLTTGLQDTADERERLTPRVTQALIDERLKLQEARRLGISLTQEELDNAISGLERQNGLAAGGVPEFARQNNIAPEALFGQIRADLTWQKLLAQTERGDIRIDADQIDEVMSRIEAGEGQTEYHLAEIVLLADERGGVSMADIRALAERLIAQMRSREADFQSIASQFSDSATAATGGDLGWKLAGEISPSLVSTVLSMSLGSISPPIEDEQGIRIIALVGRRIANAVDSNDTQVGLRVMFLRLPETATQAQVQAKLQEANEIRTTITSCDDFRRQAAALGTPQPDQPNQFKFGDINPQMRAIIAGLAEGGISEPLPTNIGLQLVMVCEREIVTNLPSRAEIRTSLVRERIETVSSRRLRDLRRAAFIEFRE